jgi:hypothetical protein
MSTSHELGSRHARSEPPPKRVFGQVLLRGGRSESVPLEAELGRTGTPRRGPAFNNYLVHPRSCFPGVSVLYRARPHPRVNPILARPPPAGRTGRAADVPAPPDWIVASSRHQARVRAKPVTCCLPPAAVPRGGADEDTKNETCGRDPNAGVRCSRQKRGPRPDPRASHRDFLDGERSVRSESQARGKIRCLIETCESTEELAIEVTEASTVTAHSGQPIA